jgi:predicted extracellular nuclease
LPIGAANVVDFVGYGSANCAETAPAESHSNTTSIRRNFNGCMETENNGTDFSEAAVLPRNGASPPHRCDTPPDAVSISEIQGTNIISPLVDQFITTPRTLSLRCAIMDSSFKHPTPAVDGNPISSEGLFVLTGGAPNVNVGNGVVVSGTVIEFKPASDPASPTRTQINAGKCRDRFSSAMPCPRQLSITADDMPPGGGLHLLERFEGMRVRVEQFTVTAPTEGFLDEPNGTATSTGVFYGTPSGVPRPLREPGIGIMETLPAQAPCCVPRFDENPELLRVDSNAQLGVSVLNASTHTVISNFTGVLFYEARRYTLLRDPGTVALTPPQPQPLPTPALDEVTIGAMNLEHFYNDRDDTNVADVVLTSNAYSNRLQKAALLIRDRMGTPDILGLAEIENLSVLADLAAAVSSNYSAHLFEGNDFGGIDVGFLVNTAKVSIIEVRQEGKTNLFHVFRKPAVLHDRPPLILRARVADPFTTNDF